MDNTNETMEGRADVQAHYTNSAIQPIDVIRKVLTPEELRGFLKGNIIKYRLRAGKKGPALQDIGKAEQYEDWLKDMDKKSPQE